MSLETVWRDALPRTGPAFVRCPDLNVPCGWKVQVTALHGGLMAHIEASGIDTRIFCSKLDFGIELRTFRGNWLPESHWKAQRWLWRARKMMNIGRLHHGGQGLTLERVDQILVRWQKEAVPR